MKYLTILAVLTLACSGEDITPRQCNPMTLSDANPVQFWTTGCETWNESRPKGVHHYCFCQPFECDDEIKVQFQDNSNSIFTLSIYDDNDSEIGSIPFGGNIVLDTLSNFVTNGGVGTAWVSGSNPSIASIPVFGSSEILRGLVVGANNNHDYSFIFSINATGTYDLQFYFLDESFGIIATSSIPFLDNNTSGNVTLNAPSGNITYLGVKISNDGAGSLTGISVQSIEYSPVASMDMLETFVTNGGAGTAWVSSANPSIASIGVFGGSEILRGKFHNAESGKSYSFNYSINATGLYTISFYFLNSSFGIVSSFETPTTSASNSTGSVNLNGTGASYFGIAITNQSTSSSLTGVSVQSLDFVEPQESTIYQVSFVPSDYDICDQEISLKIKNGSNVIFKSDCLSIKSSHNESLLINYSNHNNFAGIRYPDVSPDTSFNIRIPAVFFVDRYPQEGEDFTLSNNTVLELNSQVKLQRQLSTDRMPKYMHKKMVLVLQHQFLYIDGEYWIKGQEEYSKSEKKNKRDSFDMYTCWLTNKNFVVRNIL